MKDYLKQFATIAQYESWLSSNNYIEPSVSHTLDNNVTHYHPISPAHDYSQDYFTIVSLEDNNEISFQSTYDNGGSTKYGPNCTIDVSTDNGQSWISKTAFKNTVSLATLNNGEKLLIRANNTYYYVFDMENDKYNSKWCRFISTKNFNIEGNILSLIYNDNFANQTSLPLLDNDDRYSYSHFCNLFKNCTTLISAENLILNVTQKACYNNMFWGCTSLTIAPELPATTLAMGCYSSMFEGCTSLTTAPELPATTLAVACYDSMFNGCTNLNYIKCLATDISATNCTYNWVQNVAASGTFVKDASMSSWTTGNNGTPSSWTVQDAV